MLSKQTKLDILGFFFVLLLAAGGWQVAHPFTWFALFPLSFIGYGIFRIIFELTWNRKQVPTLATGFVGRAKMIEILKAAAALHTGKRPFTIMDFGSGRGELTRAIARALPHADVRGVELAPIPFWQSVWMQRLFGPPNLSYRRADFFTIPCADLDAAVFYLSGTFALRVGEKLFQEMKPGGLVASHTFPLQDFWGAGERHPFRSPFQEEIYVYRKPSVSPAINQHINKPT